MFFYEIIDTESLRSKIPVGDSPQMQEVHKRIVSIVHNSILAFIFTRLSTQQKDEFGNRFIANPNDRTLIDYLVEHAGPTIKDDIQREFAKVVEKLTPMLAQIPDEDGDPYST